MVFIEEVAFLLVGWLAPAFVFFTHKFFENGKSINEEALCLLLHRQIVQDTKLEAQASPGKSFWFSATGTMSVVFIIDFGE